MNKRADSAGALAGGGVQGMFQGCDPADMGRGRKTPTVQRSFCGCVTPGPQAGVTVSLDHGPKGDVVTSFLCKNRSGLGWSVMGDMKQEGRCLLPWETLKAGYGTCP